MYTRNVKNKLRSWIDRWMERVLHGKCVGKWDVQGATSRGMRRLIRRRSIQAEVVHPTDFPVFLLFFFFSLLVPAPRYFRECKTFEFNANPLTARLPRKIDYATAFSFLFSFFLYSFLSVSAGRSMHRSQNYLGKSLRITKDNDIPRGTTQTGNWPAKPHAARS